MKQKQPLKIAGNIDTDFLFAFQLASSISISLTYFQKGSCDLQRK